MTVFEIFSFGGFPFEQIKDADFITFLTTGDGSLAKELSVHAELAQHPSLQLLLEACLARDPQARPTPQHLVEVLQPQTWHLHMAGKPVPLAPPPASAARQPRPPAPAPGQRAGVHLQISVRACAPRCGVSTGWQLNGGRSTVPCASSHVRATPSPMGSTCDAASRNQS